MWALVSPRSPGLITGPYAPDLRLSSSLSLSAWEIRVCLPLLMDLGSHHPSSGAVLASGPTLA